jgi:hypothetical protein
MPKKRIARDLLRVMSIKVRGQRAGASRESLQSSVQVLYL